MWPCGLKTFLVVRYLWKDSSFLTREDCWTRSLIFIVLLRVHLSHWKLNGSKASWLATGTNTVEIYWFPLNLSPLAINFYSVTKNRLMARMSLPPTHLVQWEDEPVGGGVKSEKERETESEGSYCSVDLCCLCGCLPKKWEERCRNTSFWETLWRAITSGSHSENRTASDFARASRATTASMEFMHTLSHDTVSGVFVSL